MKKYKADKAFHHDQLGSVKKGQEFEANDAQLGAIKGFVSEVKTKVDHQKYDDKSEKNTNYSDKKAK